MFHPAFSVQSLSPKYIPVYWPAVYRVIKALLPGSLPHWECVPTTSNEKMRYTETVIHCPHWMTADSLRFLRPQDPSREFKSFSFPFREGVRGRWSKESSKSVSPNIVCRWWLVSESPRRPIKMQIPGYHPYQFNQDSRSKDQEFAFLILYWSIASR